VQIQQLSVKVFAHQDQDELDQGPLIPIFHRWIREKRLGDELLIDVADYRHVPDGPGIMLIGDQSHYGLDSRAGQLGFCYQRKRDPIGDAQPRLNEAFGAILRACQALQDEPSLLGELSFDPGRLEVRVMSRLVAPNTAATYDEFVPHLRQLIAHVYGDAAAEIEPIPDPKQPFGVLVRVPGDHAAAALAARL
jgi:hypothetical protein